MDLFVSVILIGFLIGAAAYVYAVVLQMPGELLSFLQKAAAGIPEYLAKPLITCQKCVAGQWALWSYFLIYDNWNPVIHFFQVTTSIFFAVLITKILGDGPARPRRKSSWTPPEVN